MARLTVVSGGLLRLRVLAFGQECRQVTSLMTTIPSAWRRFMCKAPTWWWPDRHDYRSSRTDYCYETRSAFTSADSAAG